MDEGTDLGASLDELLAARPYWLHLGAGLRRKLNPGRGEPTLQLISAFDYMLTIDDGATRDRWGPFAPIIEISEGVYPTPVDRVDEATLALWATLADRSADPIVLGRLNDLLWTRRWGSRPDLRARSALAAYRTLGSEKWSPLYRAHALLRGRQIAVELRDERQTEAVDLEVEIQCRAALATHPPIPGVTMLLLEALIGAKQPAQTSEIEALLKSAVDGYPDRPDVFEAVKDLEASWARQDRERVHAAQLAIVSRWRQAAAETSGLAKQVHLEKALDRARLHGFTEVAQGIRREIQEVSIEELDLKEFSADVSVPRARIDAMIDAIAGGPDWEDCLERFGTYGPPTGDPAENRRAVDEQRRQFPLQFLIRRVLLSSEGYPLHIAVTEVEHLEAALAQHETLAVTIWRSLGPQVLLKVFDRHGRPERAELTRFFTRGIIAPHVAERIAVGLERFLDGDHDDATHVLIPRIEAVVRELCRRVGLVIIREPREGKVGGVRPLGELVAALEGYLDEKWRRYLRNVLADPVGTNLRNRVAHGLLEAASAGDAAVCLHIACFLRLLDVRPNADAVPGESA